MNQAAEHFLFAPEGPYGTFVAPNKALPITSCDITGRRGIQMPPLTSFQRGRGIQYLADKPVTGKIEILSWPDYLTSVIKTFLTSLVSTHQGATAAWRHKFLYDDSVPLGSLSLEKQFSTTEAQFLKGAMVAGYTVGCRAKEAATWSLDLIAQDDAWAGGTWESGAAAPAAPTTPVPYPAVFHLPFRYYQGRLLYGGSVSKVTNELVVAGGVAIAAVETVEITVAHNLDPVPEINLTPCIAALRPQGRTITLKMDLDWISADDDYIDYHRANQESILQLQFVGATIEAPYTYEMTITLPRVAPAEALPPAVQGDKKRRTHSITYEALIEAVTLADFGLVIQNAETAIA